jgi:anti-sigma factor RsiW
VARWVAPAIAAGLLATTGVLLHGGTTGRGDELALFTTEAVNDYLRVLNSQRRVEVKSGGPHQVKPWFEGKLDFAPDVPELPALTLRGGSVRYFKNRKAAVIVYTLRLHTVTLLEVRAADLPWPSDAHEVRATSTATSMSSPGAPAISGTFSCRTRMRTSSVPSLGRSVMGSSARPSHRP